MKRTIFAVIDATRARLFTFDRADEVGGTRESLVERIDLVNPARRRTTAQLFSDTRTNTNRTGGRFYGVDDHRNAHIAEIDAEFARSVASAIDHMMRDTEAMRVVVCAPPRMLGMLRTADLQRDGVVIDELAHDYTKMTAPQIRELLGQHHLLPASRRRRVARERAHAHARR